MYDGGVKLSAVEIQGFKSFAARTQLRFSEGITAVIGPNGSGKSNISDAVRWVLGEQSSKLLRGKERTDVIFSGSDGKAGARRASVALTFDNEDGRFPFDAPEVTISRTLTRDGESEYSINGDPVRLLDLQQALAEAGIGAKSYTVISQGMVDRYLTATPEGRQELFDEATGVRSLQLKVAAADKKLRATQAHAQEIETILHELKPRLTVLKRQVDRHHERESCAAEFTQKQAAWLRASWHQYMRLMEQAEAHVAAANDHIAATRRARQAVEGQLLRAATAPMPDNRLHQQWQQAKAEYEAAAAEYKRVTALRQELTLSVAAVEAQLRQAESQLHEKRETSLHFDWLKQTRALLRSCQDVVGAVLDGRAIHRQQMKKLFGDIETLLAQTTDSTSVSLARSVLEQIEAPLQEVARLKAIKQERSSQLQALPQAAAPSRERLDQLAAALQAERTQPTPGGTEMQLEEVREAELAAEREGSAVRAGLEQARQELHELEQEILRERGSQFLQETQAASPSDIAQAPTQAELQHLARRLSELGQIDPLALKEYEEVRTRYDHLTQQMNDISQTQRNIEQLKKELEGEIRTHFEKQFTIIQQAFARYFVELFGGGKAALTLTAEGIDIMVCPPGKRPRHITLLSGGERALTSLALLLAIIEAGQPPFIMFDEVDAALDEANSERLARILHQKSLPSTSSGQATQCIIISHNRQTMAIASVLYGVTMQQDGVSKVYSVKLNDLEELGELLEAGEKMVV